MCSPLLAIIDINAGVDAFMDDALNLFGETGTSHKRNCWDGNYQRGWTSSFYRCTNRLSTHRFSWCLSSSIHKWCAHHLVLALYFSGTNAALLNYVPTLFDWGEKAKLTTYPI
ncbi:hypothetical protein BDA96_04G017700 [Sorghum bicolor]|uniref:Uncharacterized protein n=2 Tax=Sorghum bicolor TaxID=4558 RepID=A0A921UHM0_SORBI|nr:hypothetical protein BDA96_04G017700 [Sorghum bicolor]OQU84223.1 hypothetical protein SORBI_3004G015550 [Sorghum bicolor]